MHDDSRDAKLFLYVLSYGVVDSTWKKGDKTGSLFRYTEQPNGNLLHILVS